MGGGRGEEGVERFGEGGGGGDDADCVAAQSLTFWAQNVERQLSNRPK